MTDDIQIREVAWAQAGQRLLAIRFRVFVDEQGVPPELERDAQDPLATHLLASDRSGNDVATGRLLRDGHIGRMAVLADWRGQGIGGAVLLELLRLARQRGLPQVFLNAQCSATGFYQRFGFQPEGAVFDDAGIPHRRMYLDLDPAD